MDLSRKISPLHHILTPFSYHHLSHSTMDYQNRAGSKQGSGGVASASATDAYRRKRLRELMSSRVDVENDPYFFTNHLGLIECKLCLTTHISESSVVSHIQGKKHELNLMRRVAQEKESARDPNSMYIQTPQGQTISISNVEKKKFVKIGRPAYKIVKMRDPLTYQLGLIFQVHFKDIADGVTPKFRLMSTFEQSIEPHDNQFQYVVVSGEPYENVAFKIPSQPIDKSEGRCWDYWDIDSKDYYVQLFYDGSE